MQDHITSSGTDLSFYVVVVSSSGNHVDPDGWLASPASARPVLQSHPSTVPSAVRNASGDYTFSFSGLSPAISDGTVALVAVTGAINGTAWTPWYERVLVRNKATINSDVVSSTQTTINNNYLQYLFASGYDPTSKPGSASGVINSLIDATTRRFSATALELAPQGSGGAGGSGDWTSTEKSQIRYVLGLDGTTATPTATPSGLFRSNLVRIDGVLINGTGEVPVSATSIRTAVGLASANLDTQLDNIPTVTEFNARTLPSGTYSVLSSGDVQSIVTSGVTATQSTQASNAQTGATASLNAYDPPTRAELTTDKLEIIASGITQSGVRSAVGLASANLDTQLDAIPTVTEMNARTLPSGTYSTLTSGNVVSATQTTIENNQLQYLFASTYDPTSKPGSATSIINSLIDSSVRQFSATALELGPTGSGGAGGSGDWTSTEKSQIRYVLGLDGSTATPTASPSGLFRSNLVRVDGVVINGTGEVPVNAISIRNAVGLASANLDTQLADVPTVSEFNARTLPSGQYLSETILNNALASGVTVNVISSGAFQDIFETYSMVEDYPANGATGTPAEFLYLMKQAFTEFTINGTTITVKKLDGSTTAATYTMDSATTPTSRTRAT